MMIIDHRQNVLDVTKGYNNLRNYFLNKSYFKKGNKEVDRNKILRCMFPNDLGNSSLIQSDRDRINNWFKKSNTNISSEDYLVLSKHIHNHAFIFFKDIDQICEFENSILKACFDRFISFVNKNFGKDEIIDIAKLKEVALNDEDHFYFQVVASAISFSRLTSGRLLEMELDISCQGLNLKKLKCYLTTALNIIDKNILEYHKVFFNSTYKNARAGKADPRAIDVSFDGTFFYRDSPWYTQDQMNPFKLAMNNDEDYMYRTGMHLTIFGRFRRYINLSLYSSKWNKSIEIIAVNNWINLFEFLKKEMVLHSVNYEKQEDNKDEDEDEDKDEDDEHIFETQCMCVLASVRDFNSFKAKHVRNCKGLDMDLSYINAVGKYVTVMLLAEYVEVVNSTTDAFFID